MAAGAPSCFAQMPALAGHDVHVNIDAGGSGAAAVWSVTVPAMAKLVYSAIMSLDGYTADGNGSFDWSAPDSEVHTFINDLERGFGTYLYGRRMYETMVYWETFDAVEDQPPCVRDYAWIWRAAAKVVYSRTLGVVSSARTRIERAFDPGAVLRMKETAGHDMSVGGADLASQAIAAGLVDEMHLFLTPVTVGAGTPALPGHFHSSPELLRVDRFAGGVVHLQYRISS
ncbi:MAG TPA: dihydrofolate reductase family protein [Streptosporangiaceae bacterium]|nr:dihydrofolate reductase family protein [Streptosporangiaceae bacterium]